jgi:hypothetical protein
MSAQQQTGFGQFIPGFDFLQQLAKGGTASMPQMPNLSSWVAPTLNVEELEKRIGELKAVQFWLEQNTTALSATIQALEVQKMTLATLKGMNVQMADLAQAMKVKPFGGGESATAKESPSAGGKSAKGGKANGATGGDGNVVDPLQWWSALTRQFQEIATNAMQEVAAATEPGKRPAKAKAAAAAAGAPASKRASKPKRTARKSAA